MSLAPLLNAPVSIQLHAFSAMAAFAIGILQFAGPKGTLPHRAFGFLWLGLMLTVAITSFWISGHGPRIAGPFGPIHLLSIFVLLMAPLALYWVRRRNIRGHAMTVIGMFIGGLVIAGGFTFIPGRLMNAVAFGP
jgi:uncharacterized membrane protein